MRRQIFAGLACVPEPKSALAPIRGCRRAAVAAATWVRQPRGRGALPRSLAGGNPSRGRRPCPAPVALCGRTCRLGRSPHAHSLPGDSRLPAAPPRPPAPFRARPPAAPARAGNRPQERRPVGAGIRPRRRPGADAANRRRDGRPSGRGAPPRRCRAPQWPPPPRGSSTPAGYCATTSCGRPRPAAAPRPPQAGGGLGVSAPPPPRAAARRGCVRLCRPRPRRPRRPLA